MITFFAALAFLIVGYLTYGKVVEHIFGPDERPTPAVQMADGVDYVEMPTCPYLFITVACGALAVIGVVICPITSGDTAFRSTRLTLADWFQIDQRTLGKTDAALAAGAVLTKLDFNIIWRYFSWSNQTFAMIVLWAVAVYLR